MAGALDLACIRARLDVPGQWTLHRFEQVDSTNTLALEWATDGAAHRTVCIAEGQTAGRGRGERLWRTPKGTALALSVIVRRLNATRLSWIGLAAGVAVIDAIADVTGIPAQVKWPNDVLIRGKKVAGILVESRSMDDLFAVVGVGLNVNNPAAALPQDLRASAASLIDVTGRAVDRNHLAAALLNALDRQIALVGDQVESVSQRWSAANATQGCYVSILTPSGSVDGMDEGLDASGRLLIRRIDGHSQAVHSGEVLLCRTTAPPLV